MVKMKHTDGESSRPLVCSSASMGTAEIEEIRNTT